jgi:ankyrin repeat protein
MANLRSILSDAAQSGDLDRLRSVLEENRSFASMPDEEGYTPLHYAAYFGHLEAARYLLSIGAELTAITLDPLRSHPLHAAASSGHAKVAAVLLDAGADPNAEQTGQWTPLHSAAAGGHAEIVTMLLQRGADPDRRSASGATPKDLAQERGHANCVEALPDADYQQPRANSQKPTADG